MKAKAKPQQPVEVSSTPQQIATRHNTSLSYVYGAIADGRLKAFKLGGKGPLRITTSAEREWIEKMSA